MGNLATIELRAVFLYQEIRFSLIWQIGQCWQMTLSLVKDATFTKGVHYQSSRNYFLHSKKPGFARQFPHSGKYIENVHNIHNSF